MYPFVVLQTHDTVDGLFDGVPMRQRRWTANALGLVVPLLIPCTLMADMDCHCPFLGLNNRSGGLLWLVIGSLCRPATCTYWYISGTYIFMAYYIVARLIAMERFQPLKADGSSIGLLNVDVHDGPYFCPCYVCCNLYNDLNK